ncbi:hypothetical protein [Actinoplanes auranticolor]|uniref:Uncharacterized protein n=1 Tax=Actinoplanes auranticolor TaxID=47988 RepID=A0A919SLG2_9ACTN|nr:hypothetical protein [Actinoplanes auranticolor]GIM73607.1 hypothetical protein Aau02nite_56810 [Actinoplanes auranticolor]
MRKWFYAGAVVGGFLLLGAAPAQADVVPAPAGGLLGSLSGSAGQGLGAAQGLGLDPAGGLNLASPLGGSPLMGVKPGQNSADLTGPAAGGPAQGAARTRTREADDPAGRRPARGSAPADLPVIGGRGSGLTGGSARGNVDGDRTTVADGQSRGGPRTGALGNLIPANLLGGGLLGGGLTPDGRTAPAGQPRESALFDGGVPLLGGLGGLLPANEAPRTLPATGDDAPTGMPAGGTDVDPAVVDPALVDPAPAAPADGRPGQDGKAGKDGSGDQAAGPAADQPVDDPRLHEEPVDDEAGGKKRTFSDGGRPVAGEDEDFR